MIRIAESLKAMEDNGFAVIREVFTTAEVESIADRLESRFRAQSDAVAIREHHGSVYAARNVLSLWPEASSVWRRPLVLDILMALLGPRAGLVRGLYFDKPPERSWALPWHKDLTIAVCDNRLPSNAFSKPTIKANVPHVEAPLEVLERMATLRIHLDDVTDDNGPLRVIPGSHRAGKAMPAGDVAPLSILASAGDVLLMRPLLAHASNHSRPGTERHRRILHLEFGTADLPDGYCWFNFWPIYP